jgi:hypothetical protein
LKSRLTEKEVGVSQESQILKILPNFAILQSNFAKPGTFGQNPIKFF